MGTYTFLGPAQIVKTDTNIQKYLDLITSQHKTQPKFNSWLSATLTLVDDGITATNAIPAAFDVDNAVGSQLDVLGQIIGRSRALTFQPSDGSPPTLDDTNYRIALKAKIAQNQWDGTIPQIYDIWSSLFPDLKLSVVDNQNMTMATLIDGQIDPVINEMLAMGYIVPKPSGVKLTIIETESASGNEYVGILVSGIDYITVSTNTP